MDHLSSSIASLPSKEVAVSLVARPRDVQFCPETLPRKMAFKTLFGILVLHLGRVLYQIVITISGFFPMLVVFSHIVGFALERCLDIMEAQELVARLSKILISCLEIAVLGMVCALDEGFALCVVTDAKGTGQGKATIKIPASSKVSDLFQEIGKKMRYQHDSFKLLLLCDKKEVIVLNNKKSETIETAGLKLDSTNNLILLQGSEKVHSKSDEYSMMEEAAGPMISGDFPTPDGPPPPPPPPPPPLPSSTSGSGDYNHSSGLIRHEIGYVGLVNQAMTCYLNSLLQALFMTPEFRNALYNWEFDGSQRDESKSIPYQLQKLFLNLQTSSKSAVETTELTRSFGWDSSEAWQQHDIQELCRVMFDALEQKFKNTEQADLINRLYEGKMIDYVKCLECSTEKFREDTFLDIPLPLRPFGNNTAYGSVEEALRAFVQPETLEGNNQYHCETCNKKCDAHKGLKFSKFPYLLTLHLKRFDFDYNTLHRIKLNDKVTFPEKLDLNSFIVNTGKMEDGMNETSTEEGTVKCDDSSTTDSGSALDDESCQGIDAMAVTNSHENHNTDYQEDDEGIDVCQHHENEKNRQNIAESGPYVYELFSIMIHSGSAAGGHYYAYIKDFNDGEWYCFNDQTVTKITYEDIKKTYGGGSLRGYYSGAYSSSTNAYMLMYRQIDPQRNASAMTVDEFPPHIKALHKKLEEQKDLETRIRESDLSMFKLKFYCRHPELNIIVENKVYLYNTFTLREGVKLTHSAMNLDKIVPVEQCRLVSYDRSKDLIECSFEGKEDVPLSELIQTYKSDFLLEIRNEGEEFEVYKPGNIVTKVHLLDIETEEVKSPVMVRANLHQTVGELKEIIAKQLKLPVERIYILFQNFSNIPRVLLKDDSILKREGFYGNNKIYVVTFADKDEIKKSHILSKLLGIIDTFENVITLRIALPNVDNEILEKLNIPPLEQPQSNVHGITPVNRQTDELLMISHSRGASPNDRDSSPQPLPDPEDECMGPAEPHSDQSASEDSSLTDSERTIVGEAPGDCLSQLSPSNSSVSSEQNVSSPENEGNDHDMKTDDRLVREKFINCYTNNEIGELWDADEPDPSDYLQRNCNYYFKATPYVESSTSQKMLKVLVDKRMTQRTLKRFLEPFVGVSSDHFKVYKSDEGFPDDECSNPNENLTLHMDEDVLTVKLGRILKKGEYIGNVYLLALDRIEPFKLLFEWVIANGSRVGQVKKEILEEIKKKCAIEIPYNRCRLRKKHMKNAGRPYLDDSIFEDLSNHWELVLQTLPYEEPLTSPNQKLLFIRQWCPSTLQLKPFQEIVLDTNQVSECKEKISQLSGIPVENIDIAKVNDSFPCIHVSILTIHSDLDWNQKTTCLLDRWPLNIYGDGQVIFYRDNRERVKNLSIDERKEILSRENRGKSRLGTIFSYSPRKEKALKIYLDTTPPRRREETDVD